MGNEEWGLALLWSWSPALGCGVYKSKHHPDCVLLPTTPGNIPVMPRYYRRGWSHDNTPLYLAGTGGEFKKGTVSSHASWWLFWNSIRPGIFLYSIFLKITFRGKCASKTCSMWLWIFVQPLDPTRCPEEPQYCPCDRCWHKRNERTALLRVEKEQVPLCEPP